MHCTTVSCIIFIIKEFVFLAGLLFRAEKVFFFCFGLPVGQVSQSIDVSRFLQMFLVPLLVLGYMSAVTAHHQSLYPTLPPPSPLSFHQLPVC